MMPWMTIPALLLTGYGLLILYYRFLWQRVPKFRAGKSKSPDIRLSVIVAVRNEEKNIRECLHSLLVQDYPISHTEIMIVDDHSTDQTVRIIQECGQGRVQVRRMNEGMGKKAAITEGVRAASGELVVCTDADCLFPPNWLSTIVAFREERQSVFIAAPVRIRPNKSFLSVFQSLDFLSLQGIAAAATHHGFHRMSNGANLAFTKESFESVGGYAGIDQLPTGDDMLLMEKMEKAFPGGTGYCLAESAIVDTAAETSWKGFLQQRIRWASKARVYEDKRTFLVLLLVYAMNAALLLLGIAALFLHSLFVPFLWLILFKTLVELLFLWPVARFYGLVGILPWFPIAQPFHLLYTVLAGFFGQVYQYQWKGRTWKK
jgi:cellulose synthase/poly-beta-1,6-N-acetylglucosamine synthase-like glycosyltransferase